VRRIGEPTLWTIVDARSLAQGHPDRLDALPSLEEIDALRPADLVAVVLAARGAEELFAWTLCGRVEAVLEGALVIVPLKSYDELAITPDDRIAIEPSHVIRCQHFGRHETPRDTGPRL
jgi:hypothetical protein